MGFLQALDHEARGAAEDAQVDEGIAVSGAAVVRQVGAGLVDQVLPLAPRQGAAVELIDDGLRLGQHGLQVSAEGSGEFVDLRRAGQDEPLFQGPVDDGADRLQVQGPVIAGHHRRQWRWGGVRCGLCGHGAAPVRTEAAGRSGEWARRLLRTPGGPARDVETGPAPPGVLTPSQRPSRRGGHGLVAAAAFNAFTPAQPSARRGRWHSVEMRRNHPGVPMDRPPNALLRAAIGESGLNTRGWRGPWPASRGRPATAGCGPTPPPSHTG